MLSEMGLASPAGLPEKAACEYLETYNDSVQYCGRGCDTWGALVTHPGTCLNRACFDHDACYAAYECAGTRSPSAPRTVGLDCVFSEAVACCDQAMEDTADACEREGSGRALARVEVPELGYARVYRETGDRRAADATWSHLTIARQRAAAEDTRFHAVRLMVRALRASPRTSCVAQLGGAATCNEPKVGNDCRPLPVNGTPSGGGGSTGGGGGTGGGTAALCSRGGGENGFDCCLCANDDRVGWSQCVQSETFSGQGDHFDFERCCRNAGGEVVSPGRGAKCAIN
jgi:hypothetical protein